ncbi:MAG: Mur ligase family protein [Acidobacteria bacterium]|nr:Mur ligase family protein [Acidobacteriota bacterium]
MSVSQNTKSIHLIAIGGTGVAPLACLLQAEGYQVRGSDGPLYPPMSTLLEEHGITPLLGFEPSNLDPPPDLVIVGNAVPRSNPQAVEAERLGLPRMSMPEALSHFFLDGRRPLVVAGTHGKTTTSSIAAFVYRSCGQDPGYLIGGMPVDLPASFARGGGRRFVVEGDEYNAAYFDRGPKFLHYQPETLILTGVEHDHVDLYPDAAAFRAAFRDLLEILPEEGLVVADGDSQAVRDLTREAPCRVVHYGLGEHNEVRPSGAIDWRADGTRCRIVDDEVGASEIELRLAGDHNLKNALAVWAVARRDGLPADGVVEALRRFGGVERRLEEIGEADGVVVVDDFAHHPTEIGKTLAALRQRHPGRRLVAAFEPRSLTAGRSFFFDAYLEAFSNADVVLLAPIYHHARLEDDERIDLDALTATLRRSGVDAHTFTTIDDMPEMVLPLLEAGDVLVTMSSGPFAAMPRRILQTLEARKD